MSKLLGLLDTLEALVLDAKKVPMTSKILLEDHAVTDLITKCRMVVQEEKSKEQDHIREQVLAQTQRLEKQEQLKQSEDQPPSNQTHEFKKEVKEYANYVLTNLHLTIAKMQTNLKKLEKNIESGRKSLAEPETISTPLNI